MGGEFVFLCRADYGGCFLGTEQMSAQKLWSCILVAVGHGHHFSVKEIQSWEIFSDYRLGCVKSPLDNCHAT